MKANILPRLHQKDITLTSTTSKAALRYKSYCNNNTKNESQNFNPLNPVLLLFFNLFILFVKSVIIKNTCV